MTPSSHFRRAAPFLWVLLGLFCARVLGQVVVAFAGVSFLPPMEEWYSGLIAYPYLLGAQIVIIALLIKVCLDFTRGEGFFVRPRRLFGHAALYFGYISSGKACRRYSARTGSTSCSTPRRT